MSKNLLINEKITKLYSLIDKCISKSISMDELKDLAELLINNNPYFQEREIKVVFSKIDIKNDFFEKANYSHNNTITINELLLQEIIDNQVPVADLFISVFHELRHHVQYTLHDIVKKNRNISKPNFSKELNESISSIISDKKLSKSDISVYLEICSPFIKIPKKYQADKASEIADNLSYILYLDLAHEMDAREKAIEDTKFFLKRIYEHYSDLCIDINEFFNEQADYVYDEYYYYNSIEKDIDDVNKIFNLNLSKNLFQKILKRINEISNKIKPSENLDFEITCNTALSILFEKTSFSEKCAYYIFLMSGRNKVNADQKNNHLIGNSVVTQFLYRNLMFTIDSATEQEKLTLSSKLFELAKTSTDDILNKNYINLMTDTDLHKTIYLALTNPRYGKILKFDNLLFCLKSNNRKDKLLVERILDYYNKNYNSPNSDKLKPEQVKKQYKFSKHFKYLMEEDKLFRIMEIFNLDIEFQQIMERPVPEVYTQLDTSDALDWILTDSTNQDSFSL